MKSDFAAAVPVVVNSYLIGTSNTALVPSSNSAKVIVSGQI